MPQSYDTTIFLVDSTAAVEPTSGCGQASPNTIVESGRVPSAVPNVDQSTTNQTPYIPVDAMQAIWSELLAPVARTPKSTPAFCGCASSLPLTPQTLKQPQLVCQYVRDVRVARKMPQALASHLHTACLFADWVLALSPAPEHHSADTYLLIVQGITFYGTDPTFLARKKQLRDCFGRWYHNIVEMDPAGLAPDAYNSLCALFVVLEWFWTRLQKVFHGRMDAPPYGIKYRSAEENVRKMGSEDAAYPDGKVIMPCDYGRGFCPGGQDITAVCILCKSKYHVHCMQRRCARPGPPIPCDGRSVFWSYKYSGIICPSCAREQSPDTEPYGVLDWGEAMSFSRQRANAVMDLDP